MDTSANNKLRSINAIIPAKRKEAAKGFFVDSPLPNRVTGYLDPFIMLDHFGPFEIADPDSESNIPDHPHRGFEAVTILFDGRGEHKDSVGHHTIIRSGGVQWITAASGVIHSEKIKPENGRIHGIQLWVNLPAAHKMDTPKYQNIRSAQIPVITEGETTIRVISGELKGETGPAHTFTPMTVAHIIIQKGGQTVIKVPQEYNAGIYVTEGEGEINGEIITQKHLVHTNNDGTAIKIDNKGKIPLNMLLLAGRPIGEPVAAYGPFVMNTNDQIRQAIDDYQSGRMGEINF